MVPAHSSLCPAQLALGNGRWTDVIKWIKNVQTQDCLCPAPGAESPELASAQGLVPTLLLASPGRRGWSDGDRQNDDSDCNLSHAG